MNYIILLHLSPTVLRLALINFASLDRFLCVNSLTQSLLIPENPEKLRKLLIRPNVSIAININVIAYVFTRKTPVYSMTISMINVRQTSSSSRALSSSIGDRSRRSEEKRSSAMRTFAKFFYFDGSSARGTRKRANPRRG